MAVGAPLAAALLSPERRARPAKAQRLSWSSPQARKVGGRRVAGSCAAGCAISPPGAALDLPEPSASPCPRGRLPRCPEARPSIMLWSSVLRNRQLRAHQRNGTLFQTNRRPTQSAQTQSRHASSKQPCAVSTKPLGRTCRCGFTGPASASLCIWSCLVSWPDRAQFPVWFRARVYVPSASCPIRSCFASGHGWLRFGSLSGRARFCVRLSVRSCLASCPATACPV